MTGLPETGVKLVADNASGFLSSLSRASGGVNAFENNTRNASTSSIALGVTLGNLAAGALTQIVSLATRAGTALAGFVGDSINMAGALEAQMSGVSAVMGTTAEELDALKQLTIDLGLDPNLRVSTLEAAEAMEVLAQAGIDYTQITEGALRETVFLANATGADFATAAGIAVSGMSLFNIEAANMRDVVDGTSAVINSSVFDVNDFALALTNGGAVANSMGISFDEFATTIAAISPQFSSGQTAGTAFKNLLLRLVPSTEKAEDAMKELGLITADGANVFFDAQGNIKDMATIAGILETTLDGLSVAQQTAALKTIFGNDAMGAAIALAQVGEGEFSALADSMAQVDSGAAAATRVANFAGAMDIASGAVEAIKLQIGAEFLPVLTQLAGKFSEFVDQNAEKFIGFFSKAAGFISTFVQNLLDGRTIVGSFLAALGAVGVSVADLTRLRNIFIQVGDALRRFAQFIIENKEPIIGALKGIAVVLAGAAIAAAIAGIGSALALIVSPVGLLIAGAALLGAAWQSNFMNIQGITEQVGVIIFFNLEKARLAAEMLAKIVGFVVFEAFAKAAPVAKQLAQIVGFVVFDALKKASEAATKLGEIVLWIANTAWTNFMKVLAIATFFILKSSERMGIAIESLKGIFLLAMDQIGIALGDLVVFWGPHMENLKTQWNSFVSLVQGSIGSIQGAFNALKDAVQAVINTLSNLSVPALFTPGSPTPLEIGLDGISNAALGTAASIGAITEAWSRAGMVAGQAVNTIAILPETAAMDEQLSTIESRIQSISSGAAGLSGMEALQAIRALTFQRDQLSTPQQQSQQTAINNNNTTNNNQQQTNNFNIPGVGIPSLLEQLMAQMA